MQGKNKVKQTRMKFILIVIIILEDNRHIYFFKIFKFILPIIQYIADFIDDLHAAQSHISIIILCPYLWVFLFF